MGIRGLRGLGRIGLVLVWLLAVVGCGVTLPEVIVVRPEAPAPETPAAPEAPPSWTVVVATEPGAAVWAYEQDPERPTAETTADAAGPRAGTATLTLTQAGYSICAALDGYYSRCVGVDVVSEAIAVDLSLERVPPPPLPPPAPDPTPAPKPPAAPTPERPADPPPGGRLQLPNMRHVVEAVARERKDLLARSCQEHGGTWDFLDLVVDRLRQHDTRWGYNWKRGNVGDPSLDVVAYHYGAGPSEGSTDVYIIDVIAGHCGPNPSPAWIDQTEITRQAGAIGRWTSRGRW